MKAFRRSLTERLTNLTLALLFALLVAAAAVFSGPFWASGGLWVALVAGGAALFFVAQWVRCRELVEWRDGPPTLARRAWGRWTELALADVTAIRVVPCDMRTVLRAKGRRVVLSHKLLHFEDLLNELRAARPDLFPLPTDTLRLRTTHIGMLTLLLFAGGTSAVGWLLGGYQAWMPWPFYAAASVPLVRLLLFFPLEYRIVPGKILVVYLLRRRLVQTRFLLKQTQDVYAAGGAVFFLLRLEFPHGNIVLDEGYLRDPLRPAADWLSVALI